MSDDLQTREQMLRGLMRERAKAMSEQEKTLGQTAYKGFYLSWPESDKSEEAWPNWHLVPDAAKEDWESAAQAVAARVREKCALTVSALADKAEAAGRDEAADALDNAADQIRAMNEASHEH